MMQQGKDGDICSRLSSRHAMRGPHNRSVLKKCDVSRRQAYCMKFDSSVTGLFICRSQSMSESDCVYREYQTVHQLDSVIKTIEYRKYWISTPAHSGHGTVDTLRNASKGLDTL